MMIYEKFLGTSSGSFSGGLIIDRTRLFWKEIRGDLWNFFDGLLSLSILIQLVSGIIEKGKSISSTSLIVSKK